MISVTPERIVEIGSSFGVSAIYLAVGLRDNGAGTLIGSELIENKAATARKNVAAAGLDDLAEIRSGDPRLNDGVVPKRLCCIALGVNLDGEKDILGMWLGDTLSSGDHATVINRYDTDDQEPPFAFPW